MDKVYKTNSNSGSRTSATNNVDRVIAKLLALKNWKQRPDLIQELLSAGMKIGQIADALNTDYFAVYRLKQRNNLTLTARCGTPVPAEQVKLVKKLLMTTNLPPSMIAERAGLASNFTIYKCREKMKRRATRKAGIFQPEQVKHGSVRCPIHGPLLLTPCIACAAEEAKAITVRERVRTNARRP
jgi:hypothetical protein